MGFNVKQGVKMMATYVIALRVMAGNFDNV